MPPSQPPHPSIHIHPSIHPQTAQTQHRNSCQASTMTLSSPQRTNVSRSGNIDTSAGSKVCIHPSANDSTQINETATFASLATWRRWGAQHSNVKQYQHLLRYDPLAPPIKISQQQLRRA
ncbi:uncharacterized protein UHOD_11646 [Ustilago sp. UG-2017b]|nr:uncharacterized protein UHOD_11646 [Ustilago sp. UG-2017b]